MPFFQLQIPCPCFFPLQRWPLQRLSSLPVESIQVIYPSGSQSESHTPQYTKVNPFSVFLSLPCPWRTLLSQEPTYSPLINMSFPSPLFSSLSHPPWQQTCGFSQKYTPCSDFLPSTHVPLQMISPFWSSSMRTSFPIPWNLPMQNSPRYAITPCVPLEVQIPIPSIKFFSQKPIYRSPFLNVLTPQPSLMLLQMAGSEFKSKNRFSFQALRSIQGIGYTFPSYGENIRLLPISGCESESITIDSCSS